MLMRVSIGIHGDDIVSAIEVCVDVRKTRPTLILSSISDHQWWISNVLMILPLFNTLVFLYFTLNCWAGELQMFFCCVANLTSGAGFCATFLDNVVELMTLLTATCLVACGWGLGEACSLNIMSWSLLLGDRRGMLSVYNVLELVAGG